MSQIFKVHNLCVLLPGPGAALQHCSTAARLLQRAPPALQPAVLHSAATSALHAALHSARHCSLGCAGLQWYCSRLYSACCSAALHTVHLRAPERRAQPVAGLQSALGACCRTLLWCRSAAAGAALYPCRFARIGQCEVGGQGGRTC